jgi:RimJ/RimL family protein N-acetyltransferase
MRRFFTKPPHFLPQNTLIFGMTTMTLPPFTPIETPRLILRHFQESDIQSMLAYRLDPQVARYQGWVAFMDQETEEEIGKRVREMAALPGATLGRWFQIAVEEKATGIHIGDIGIRLQANEARQAITGYTFAREAQGKGYATETLRALLDYMFGTLGVHRVMADALAENEKSIRLLERVGFRQEGYLRDAEWFEGKWADNVIYGLLRSEWDAQKQSHE